MRSIIQKDKECYICRSPYVEDHHIFFGHKNRKNSEHYGMKVWLCHMHHTGGKMAVHRNHNTDLYLKAVAQEAFEKYYSREEFMQVFGINYLEEPEVIHSNL